MRRWFGRAKRERAEQLLRLELGEPVVQAASMRRTSSRGWGPWTDVELHLGAGPDEGAWWHAEDPLAVGFAPARGPVDVAIAAVTSVWCRPVRFSTEAFFGMDAEIVVVEGERTTLEFALDPDLTGPVAARLAHLTRP